MSKILSAIGTAIAKVLHVSTFNPVLTRRLISVCLCVFAWGLFEPLQSKTFGYTLPITILSLISGLNCLAASLAGRFNKLNLYFVRNSAVVCDLMASVGLFSLGLISGDVGTYVFILCVVLGTVYMCPLYAVYQSNVQEWVRITAGDKLKEFSIANGVYANIAALIAMVTIAILGMVLPIEVLALGIGVVFTAINVYAWKVMTETIGIIYSPEFQKKKARLDELTKQLNDELNRQFSESQSKE